MQFLGTDVGMQCSVQPVVKGGQATVQYMLQQL